jgi:hypothetical protein
MAEKDNKENEMMMEPGFRWRVALSIIVCIGWLIFLIIWLGFFAGDFNIYQNIAIFLASILGIGVILGPAWAHWGMKYGWKYDKECKKK